MIRSFPSFRARLVGLAVCFALYGALVLLNAHSPNHDRGKEALAIAGILTLAAIIPESPGKTKQKPENYDLTGTAGTP
jgi:hypothetical protein